VTWGYDRSRSHRLWLDHDTMCPEGARSGRDPDRNPRELQLRRTLSGLLEPAYSQINDYPLCA